MALSSGKGPFGTAAGNGQMNDAAGLEGYSRAELNHARTAGAQLAVDAGRLAEAGIK